MNFRFNRLSNQLSKKSTLFVLILVVCMYLTFSLMGLTGNLGGQIRQVIGLGPPDPLWEDIPPDTIHIKLQSKDVKITHYQVQVDLDEETYNISCSETPSVYRSAKTHEVLLLHGSSSTAKDWETIGTMQLLSTWGHRSVAIDIPGFGRSSSMVIQQGKRNIFLSILMKKLQLEKAVIVAPSVSGFFAIPFCLKETSRCEALVGVSVSVPTDVNAEIMSNFTVPGLAVYGKLDSFGERTARILAHAPKIFVRAIPEADVQPHLEKPEAFHRLLYNYLLKLR